MHKQFMTETVPGGIPHAFFGNVSSFIEESFIIEQQSKIQPLKRVDGIEIGLVPQTEESFVLSEHYKLVDQVGLFTSVPSIIFDSNYFDQEIRGSLAVQAGEYQFSNLLEKDILGYAQKGGFYTLFDLSQVYSICLGVVNGIYNTLNQQGTSYFFPILSKKGVLMGRINVYFDGFMFYIGRHKNSMTDVCWHKGVLISRYQRLLDPTKIF